MSTITRNVNFTWNDGAVSVGNAVKTNGVDPVATSVRAFNNTQALVTNIIEAVDLLDVDTAAQYVIMLTNKDATNYIEVSVDASALVNTIVGRMYPGESWGPVRMMVPTTGVYPQLSMKCVLGTANVEVICGEAAHT